MLKLFVIDVFPVSANDAFPVSVTVALLVSALASPVLRFLIAAAVNDSQIAFVRTYPDQGLCQQVRYRRAGFQRTAGTADCRHPTATDVSCRHALACSERRQENASCCRNRASCEAPFVSAC